MVVFTILLIVIIAVKGVTGERKSVISAETGYFFLKKNVIVRMKMNKPTDVVEELWDILKENEVPLSDQLKRVMDEVAATRQELDGINIEELHNVRRQLERSYKIAQKNMDADYLDTFDHCLQLLRRAGINTGESQ